MRNLKFKKIKSFVTFDLPVNYLYIHLSFRDTHKEYSNSISVWPVTSTRRKLIANYWTSTQLHYFLIAIAGILFTMPFSAFNSLNALHLVSLIVNAILIYIPLYFIIYRYIFINEFLPLLEAATAEYEGKDRAWVEW
ncbi:hypothetical protein SAMN05660461_1846 [Chitinophaga ginsengisegetis]|uniref:Uncharacterized protein n=1 Tax=Chitinophaga ginsengisegetis TaxID=393003 RepID=A0A1T5NJK7_9BACT|nr:hypothetical protein SAMN05660461_1846 [Chitinophaga ginsengisegetis]